ncbi:MAG: tandem-95 repeat protein [Planctomycetales bacterium]|nr:tandem-95 repeat protein [Planctomycetales bacterium]
MSTALDTLLYFNDTDFNTEIVANAETLTIFVNDLGNTDHATDGNATDGPGTPLSSDASANTALTALSTLSLTVLPTNDAPSIDVSAGTLSASSLTVEEDDSSGLGVVGIRLSEMADDLYDPDDVVVNVTLSVLHGGLTVDTTGVTLVSSTLASADAVEPLVGGTLQSLTLRGTIANLGTALDTLRYFNDADFNTEIIANAETLTIFVNDLGNTDHATDGDAADGPGTPLSSDPGVSTALTAMEMLSLTVLPTNDAPVIDVSGVTSTPANLTVAEDDASGLQIDMIRVFEDADDVYDPDVVVVNVTLSVLHGGLTIDETNLVRVASTLANADSVAPDAGNVTGSFQSITLQGTIADLNTALDTLVYYNDQDFNTAVVANAETLTIFVSDLGNTDYQTDGTPGDGTTTLSTTSGGGTELTATTTLNLTVLPTNDAPTIVIPAMIADVLKEDDTNGLLLVDTSGGTPVGITVGDLVDDVYHQGDVQLHVTLEVLHGGLQFDSVPVGVTVTQIVNAASDSVAPDLTDLSETYQRVTLTGTIADLNVALLNLRYFNDHNFNTQNSPLNDEMLLITVSDLGNVDYRSAAYPNTSTSLSEPFAQTAPGILPLTVLPSNDSPTISVPAGLVTSLNEDDIAGIDVVDGSNTGITVDDVDAIYDPNTIVLEVTLSVLHGGLKIDTSGVAVQSSTNADGADSETPAVTGTLQSVTIQGSIANLNTAMATIMYFPDQDFNTDGVDEFLTISVNDLGYTDSDTVANVSSDPAALTATASISITVNPVNDAPQFDLLETSISANEGDYEGATTVYPVNVSGGTPIVANVLPGPTTATNELNQNLTFVVTPTTVTGNLAFLSGPAIDPMTGLLSFQTAPDTNGSAIIEVVLMDDGGTANGGVDKSPVQRVTLAVAPVNDAPFVVVDATLANPTRDEDSGLVVISDWASTVLPGPSTATDEFSQILTASVAVTTSGGLTFATPIAFDPLTGDLSFKADAESNGTAVFSVTLKDDGGTPSVPGDDQTILFGPYTLTIESINDPPLPRPTNASDLVKHSYTTDEDTLLSVATVDLTTTTATKDLAGPADEVGQVLTLTNVAATSTNGGTVTINGTQIEYMPALNFFGTDTFTYTITDDGMSRGVADPQSSTGTITVTVNPVNDAPVANDDPEAGLEAAYTTDEDSLLVVAGVGAIYNDTDVDSTFLEIQGDADTAGTRGQVQFLLVDDTMLGRMVKNGDFTFDPVNAFHQLAAYDSSNAVLGVNYDLDTFRYVIVDDLGLPSNVATVTVQVNGVNDAPTAGPIPNATTSITENQSLLAIPFVGDDIDLDNDSSNLSYNIVSPTSLGAVRSGNPNANEDPSTFYFDPGTDFDDLKSGESRVVKFTYTATDRHGAVSNLATVTITVNGQNDAPEANDVTISTSASTATVASFDADDADADDNTGTLVYAADVTGLTGTKTVTVGTSAISNPVNGSFRFDPGTDFISLAAGATQTISFPYTATDSHNASDTATVTVVVTGVNDAPTVQPVSVVAIEDGPAISGTFLGDDVDTDDSQSTLVYTFIGQLPANSGTLVNNNNGTFQFNPGTDFQNLHEGEIRMLTFRYSARDSHQADSNTATGTITITGKNDTPVVAALSLATNANQPLTANFAGTDADTGTILDYMASGFQGGGTLTDNANGSFTFDPGTAFDHLAAGEQATVTFSYSANDGVVDSTLATVTITVNGTNNAPTVQDLTINAIEDGAIVTSQLAGDDVDSDDDANSLTYEITSPPSAGNLVHSGGRSFSFDPGPDFQDLALNETLDLTFTYIARDRFGSASTTIGTVTITVTGQNDAPAVSNVTGLIAVENGSPISGDFIAQDVDSDETGTGIIFTVVSQPAEGTVTPVTTAAGAKAFSFSPGAAFQDLSQGQSRQVTFTYRAADTHFSQSALATVTITVNGANDAPVAQNIAGVVAFEDGSPVNITLQASDIDSDETGSTLAYSLKSGPSVGSGSVNVSNVLGNAVAVYDPGSDFQDLSVNETSQITFTYAATDQHGAESNSAVVTVVVTGVNDAPVAQNRTLTGVSEDGPAVMGSFSAIDVDSDETGATLVYSIVSQPALGRVTANGTPGNITYMFDPNGDFDDLSLNATRNVTFTYQARDTHGGIGQATVTVTVVGTNDRPTAGVVNVSANEDGGPVTRLFIGADADSDDSQQTLNYAFTSTLSATQGTIIRDPGNLRQFIYNPGANFQELSLGETGTVQVTYTATDRHALTSAPGTIAISVAGANDAPTASSLSFNVNEGGSLTQSFGGDDIDSDDSLASLQFTLVTQPPASVGTVTNNGGGSFTFVPGSFFDSLAVGQQGTTSFTYLARDRHGVASNVATVSITVDGVNDPPTVQNINLSAVEDGGPVSGTFVGNDIDTDDTPSTIAFSIASQPSEGTASNSSGSFFTFNPGSAFQDLGVNQSRTVTFTYTAIDNRGAVSSPATVTVTVSGVNDAPIARDDQASTFEGQIQTINVIGSGAAGTDTDPDGDALTISSHQTTSAKGASVTLSANSILTYNPTPSASLNGLAAGQVTTDTFEYTVSDGRGGVSTATVTVTVTGVNNAPSAVNDTFATDANATLTVVSLGVLGNDTDPDPGTNLNVATMATSSLRGATVTSDGNGGFTYDPTAVQGFRLLRSNETLSDTFTYSATDGSLTSGLATVTITVHGVNDAPTANPETYSTSEETTLQISAFAGVLANDSDIEGDALTVSLVTSVTHGTLNLNTTGAFTYIPALNFNGNDSFVYRVSDGNSTTTATATIVVTGVNDAPVATVDVYTMSQGGTLQRSGATGVLANDNDVDNVRADLQAIARSLPTNGGVTLFADGGFIYTPTPDFAGVSTFTYQAVDPSGARSAVTTVQITVSGTGSATTWHNSVNPYDVNNDGSVSAVDALQIINDLNNNGSRVLPSQSGAPPFLDVNNDGSVTPIDVLQVVNRINSAGSGEGEGAVGATDLTELSASPIIVSSITDPDSVTQRSHRSRSQVLSSPIFRVESGVIRPLDGPLESLASGGEELPELVGAYESGTDRWTRLLDDLASATRPRTQSPTDEAMSTFGEDGLLEDVLDDLF